MEWRDEGLLLAARPHGETSMIAEVLTAERGRHLGLVRGGASKRRAAEMQPGAQLSVQWRGRLDDHLGVMRVEPIRLRAGAVLDDPLALAAMRAACAQLCAYLSEREPQPGLYAPTIRLFDAFSQPETWPALYAQWELTLLETLGFGLDLSSCAATGQTQELVWVSPKSGRAVSRGAGAPYADKLLALPAFLRLGGPAPAPAADFAAALRLTSHFLSHWAAPALELEGPPAARARLADLAERGAGSSSAP